MFKCYDSDRGVVIRVFFMCVALFSWHVLVEYTLSVNNRL